MIIWFQCKLSEDMTSKITQEEKYFSNLSLSPTKCYVFLKLGHRIHTGQYTLLRVMRNEKALFLIFWLLLLILTEGFFREGGRERRSGGGEWERETSMRERHSYSLSPTHAPGMCPWQGIELETLPCMSLRSNHQPGQKALFFFETHQSVVMPKGSFLDPVSVEKSQKSLTFQKYPAWCSVWRCLQFTSKLLNLFVKLTWSVY